MSLHVVMTHPRLLVGAAGLALFVSVSCAERRDVYLEAAENPSGFTPYDGGVVEDVDASLASPVPMCPLTTCTLPWATCPSTQFPCATNLLTDDENCGGCGIRCGGTNAVTNSKWICVDGKCQFSCAPTYADCDGDATNGCETRLIHNEENCGSCGNKCPAGWVCDTEERTCVDPCVKNGLPDKCFGICTNLKIDDDNCGVCLTKCDPLGPNLPALTADMYYGCVNAECGVPKCSDPDARNCNGDLKDGCEVRIHTNEHCAACGDACAPGKTCTDSGLGWMCLCDDGQTLCGEMGCRRLDDDPSSCGGCGYRCPGLDAPHFEARCMSGSCGGKCEDGYADCDELMANGCEVNTRVDNRNCGGCGNACLPDQVCFQGKCQVIPCDGGVPGTTK